MVIFKHRFAGTLTARSISTNQLEGVLSGGNRTVKTKREQNVHPALPGGPGLLSHCAGPRQERTFAGLAFPQGTTTLPGGKNRAERFPLGHQRLIKGIPVPVGRGGCQWDITSTVAADPFDPAHVRVVGKKGAFLSGRPKPYGTRRSLWLR